MYPRRTSSFTAGNPDAPRGLLIFHGYTGSPDEFHALAEEAATRLDAFVSVPLLPGHGTNEADLLPYRFKDFSNFALEQAEQIAASKKEFYILGHSFGGHLAILAAEKFKPKALVLTVTPYSLRWPLWLPGAAWIMRMRTYWNKGIGVKEKADRIGLSYYEQMPGIGLSLLNEGIRLSEKALPTISCPILTINTEQDPLTLPNSGKQMIEAAGNNPASVRLVVQNREHGLFYGKGWQEVVKYIVDFLEKQVKKEIAEGK